MFGVHCVKKYSTNVSTEPFTYRMSTCMVTYLITNIKNSEPLLQGAIHTTINSTHKMINGRNNGWKVMTRATVTLFSLHSVSDMDFDCV
jgi:hypothetical protein